MVKITVLVNYNIFIIDIDIDHKVSLFLSIYLNFKKNNTQ
jgi:hypothetical protein